jgi:hypothetical protein
MSVCSMRVCYRGEGTGGVIPAGHVVSCCKAYVLCRHGGSCILYVL